MRVLVVGAAGQSAGLVVPALVARGVQVRGLVHDPGQEAAAREAGADETVVADLADQNALTDAAEGADGVFGIIPVFAPDEADLGVNIVEAAVGARARKVVFSSVYHPSLTALSNHRDKQPAEAALYESALDFTILQPAVFMSQLDALWTTAQRDGVVAQPFSTGAKISYVDYRDVAEVAALAFVDERLSRGTFELAAPGMFTRHELAELMGRASGRKVAAQAPTFEDWVEQAGVPPGRVRDGLQAMMAHYDEHGFHGGNSLVLEAILGRQPTTVPAYIEQLAGETGEEG